MLTKYDPFPDYQSLQNQMNRLFGESFGVRGRADEASTTALWAPAVDIAETPERLTFNFELPGFKQEDLTLRVENGVLTLEGERKFEEESKEKSYHRVERAYGKFVRSFTLPSNADPEKIVANLTDGMLHVELPKREEAKPKSIPIGGGAKTITTGPKRTAAA